MLTVRKGWTTGFSVVALNEDGEVVALPGPVAVASSDETIATFAVNPDGTAGVMTGVGKGGAKLAATAGTLSVAEDEVVTGSIAAVALQINPTAA